MAVGAILEAAIAELDTLADEAGMEDIDEEDGMEEVATSAASSEKQATLARPTSTQLIKSGMEDKQDTDPSSEMDVDEIGTGKGRTTKTRLDRMSE